MILQELHTKLIELKIRAEITISKDLEALVEVISASEIIFSGRMHALIVGHSYGCQGIAFPSTRKLRNFDEEIIMPKKNYSKLLTVYSKLLKICLKFYARKNSF